MLILFGWGGKTKVLGEGFMLECPNCHNIRTWAVVESSRRVSVFFVPVIQWSHEYWVVCPVCSMGARLESRTQAQDLLAAALQHNEAKRSEIAKLLASESAG